MMFRVRVRDSPTVSDLGAPATIMTWRASAEQFEALQEGRRYAIYGLRTSTSSHNGVLQFSAIASTQWRELPSPLSQLFKRNTSTVEEIKTMVDGTELDFVGLVAGMNMLICKC